MGFNIDIDINIHGSEEAIKTIKSVSDALEGLGSNLANTTIRALSGNPPNPGEPPQNPAAGIFSDNPSGFNLQKVVFNSDGSNSAQRAFLQPAAAFINPITISIGTFVLQYAGSKFLDGALGLGGTGARPNQFSEDSLKSIQDYNQLKPFQFQDAYNLAANIVEEARQELEAKKAQLEADTNVPLRAYTSDQKQDSGRKEVARLEKEYVEAQQRLASILDAYRQQSNAPFAALEGQIKTFADSFGHYAEASLGRLATIETSAVGLLALLNERYAGENSNAGTNEGTIIEAQAIHVDRIINGQNAGNASAHTGGIIGEGGGGRLGSLYGIPRYHSGGLIGAREQLAVLQRGEGVFTPNQMQNADYLIATLTGSLRRIEQELIQNLGSNPRDGVSLDLLSNAITEGLIQGLAHGFLPGFLGQQAADPQSPTQTQSNAEPGQQLLQFGNESQDMLQQVEGYTADALLGMENALIQFVQTGKFEFKDLTNSILNDLLKLTTKEAITKPLTNALGNVFSGLFGGGGGGGDPRSEHLFSSLAVRHTGGIAGESTVFRRKTFGDILNHYHSGGVIGGNEEVAVLQKGEGVFTPEQMSNADHLLAKTMKAQKQPAPINVTVLIKTGNGPAKEHRGNFSADGRGGGVVTVDIAEQIEAYIAQRLARGYGPLSMVMRRRR